MRSALIRSLVCAGAVTLAAPAAHAAALPLVARFSRFEVEIRSGPVAGNPFDPADNDVSMIVRGPGGESKVPAFFDGDRTWRVRFTPTRIGTYTYHVVADGRTTLRSAPAGSFRCVASRAHGFVRVDRRHARRFAFDDGAPFFPVGHDVAWTTGGARGLSDYREIFGSMGRAGEGWARVWMPAWTGTNLEWTPGRLGWYDLDAARYIDRVFDLAARDGIYVQLVLHYHGEFSTRVNPAWNENPFNRARGGFLDLPSGFFTDARARALTRQRLRYVAARWGYSTHLMAWELFNEVQFTDHGAWDEVAAWHDEMARWLRSVDPNRHLVTTSSPPPDSPVWRSMDYLQAHEYGDDPRAVVGAPPPGSKPWFVGEWGGRDGTVPRGSAEFLHQGLFAGIMGAPSAAPMFWAWDVVRRDDLYATIGAAARFVRLAGIAAAAGALRPAPAVVTGAALGPLTVAPQLGWAPAHAAEFAIGPDTDRVDGMPSFIQGRYHADMMPHAPTLLLQAPRPTSATVRVAEISRAGAAAEIRLDDRTVLTRPLPAGAAPADLTVEVPAGRHRLTVANAGDDWYRVGSVRIDGYAPRLQARALAGPAEAIVWLVNGDPDRGAASGPVTIHGLAGGTYSVARFDLATGRLVPAGWATGAGGAGGAVVVPVAPVATDAAYLLRRRKGPAR